MDYAQEESQNEFNKYTYHDHHGKVGAIPWSIGYATILIKVCPQYLSLSEQFLRL